MKHILTLILFLFVFFGYAQERTITIDYTVDYLIPNKRKNTSDTISVGFSKDSKYIWTNSKSLAKDLGRSMFRRNPEILDNADLGIIYDTEKAVIMMCFQSGKNQLFFNFEISTFLPYPQANNTAEEFELLSDNTHETINIADREATNYNIYPSNKESDLMTVAFDESISIQNTQLFNKIFELMFESNLGSSLLRIHIPDGLIMKVSNKGETMIEAYKVDTSTKTININYSFKITE